jgi:myo-inositol 2-dehydrogenase/D-chiro-inositol 1-dehydrogenase
MLVLMLMELASGVLVDMELNLGGQFGHPIGTETVFESGVARLGPPAGPELWHAGARRSHSAQDLTKRFREAHVRQFQESVDATARGETAGPSRWDGFAIASAAGVRALGEDRRIAVELPPVPELCRVPRRG